ncbi:Y-family DNA polymerase [Paraurantiacibacter namhicola]|uniref:DNA-directed DNA polymerase n=1 Tax=Paraurantiacibacter namhicola TaxID=645517 RepID=A0A1C7D6F7_9SPHN|nr:DNA polymerase Y family protein [Paraurantiacibacter namhicola]ANU07049.1 DNA polymerase IV [Paraurantiacibacter namhicola]
MLAREGTHGPVVHAVNRAAALQDIGVGARVTDMRSLLPSLQVEDAEEQADVADLARLCAWVRRWCPWSQVDGADGADGLLLDSTGSDHLHGGEAAMARDMRRALGAAGLTARVAIAPTIGAAWALARYGGKQPAPCPEDAIARQLAPLPVHALRLDGPTVLLLRRLGIKTVGALADVPRDALVRRFRRVEKLASNPVLRLDQATGRQRELLVSHALRPPMRAARRMAEPLGDLAGLEQVLGDLCGDLCAMLEKAGSGARAVVFTAYRVDGETHGVEARTSRATRDAAHLAALFDGKLDAIDPGFGIEAATLEAVDGEGLGARQAGLVQDEAGQGGEDGEDDMAFARMIDRLVARLGEWSVLRPVRKGSHWPERGEVLVPVSGAQETVPHPATPNSPRPLRLLPNPEETQVMHAVPDGPPARFRWRHRMHNITRSSGPERIAPEWWRERAGARLRDYYHVEDTEGRRYWLYREGVAGDGRGDVTRWFVHGLDA